MHVTRRRVGQILRKTIAILIAIILDASVGSCPKDCSCQVIRNGTTVECNDKGLTDFPPGIPRNVVRLSLHGNCFNRLSRSQFSHFTNLTYLDISTNMKSECKTYMNTEIDADTFTGVTNLTTILMNNCQIYHLPKTVFKPLKKLEKIEMSNNFFTLNASFTSISYIESSYLAHLQLSCVGNHHFYGNLSEAFLNVLSKFRIKELHLNNNHITSVPAVGLRKSLPDIEVLTISHNSINIMSIGAAWEILTLPKLKRLDISNQNWHTILPVPHNYISQVPTSITRAKITIRLPDTLEWFSSSHISGHNKVFYACFIAMNLRYADLSFNHNYNISQPLFLECGNLEYVSLQACAINAFHPDIIRSATKLKTFLIGRNNISSVIRNDNGRIFRNQNKMEYLDVADNMIKNIDLNKETFKPLTRMILLNLSGNLLTDFETKLLDPCSNLKLLNLSRNAFTSISVEFRLWLEDRDIGVDFFDNPFVCDCTTKNFVIWFHKTPVNLLNRMTTRCFYNRKSIPIISLRLSEFVQKCQGPVEMPAVTVVGCTLVLLILLGACAGTVGYRYRWKLRYFWFMTSEVLRRKEEIRDETVYDYDAFIAYNRGDAQWVCDTLVPALEDESDIRLCIHDRDFTPGQIIEETIVSSIAKSRKTILVLSKHFLASSWCYFEMQIARSQLFSFGKDVIILVILEDLPPSKVAHSRTLQTLLATKTYLKWPCEEGRELFWQKLTAALQRPNENALMV